VDTQSYNFFQNPPDYIANAIAVPFDLLLNCPLAQTFANNRDPDMDRSARTGSIDRDRRRDTDGRTTCANRAQSSSPRHEVLGFGHSSVVRDSPSGPCPFGKPHLEGGSPARDDVRGILLM